MTRRPSDRQIHGVRYCLVGTINRVHVRTANFGDFLQVVFSCLNDEVPERLMSLGPIFEALFRDRAGPGSVVRDAVNDTSFLRGRFLAVDLGKH